MSNIHSISQIKREEKISGTQIKRKQAIEEEIKLAIRAALSSASENSDIFSKIVEKFEIFYSRPSMNMISLRKSTRHEKGQFFEHFCLMYLQAKNYGEAWLLGDVPDDILEELGLTRKDNGIDIIVKHPNGYFAVQAKWRSNPHKRSRIQLGWSKLATFFALAARTGPYLKHIVMTNCDSIKRNGNKNWKMDQTIAKAGFQKCGREFWQLMAGLGSGHSLKNETHLESEDIKDEKKIDENPDLNKNIKDDTRKRQAFLDKIKNIC